MTINLSQNLLDRLVCAKYIFRRNCEILDRGGPFSSGLSVSGFQDAVELFLRTIAEHLNLSLKDSTVFNEIIDRIDAVGASKVPQRSALIQLNKARVGFKHNGLEPTEQNARKFRRDLEVFFPVALTQFFGVNFEDVSLINLIGHRRAENFLRAAESMIEQEDYASAVTACAKAYAVYRLHSKPKETRRLDLDPFGKLRQSDMSSLLNNVKRAFEEQQDQIDILMSGINPADFGRFERITPAITFSMARTFFVHHSFNSRRSPDREAALFCFRFAVDSILIMKENKTPEVAPRSSSQSRFKVIKKSPLIVWPVENGERGEIEIIRDAEVGEIFYGNSRSNGNYVHVLLDGDPAFIEKAAVESLSPEGSLSDARQEA